MSNKEASFAGRAAKRWWAVLAAGLLLAAGVASSRAATPARVAAIDDASRVALSGNVSPRVRVATDLGAAPADGSLTLTLHSTRTAEQESALTALLAGQQDPASPFYHRWLTPDEFGAQFGLSAEDAARIGSWLEAQGFTVLGLAPGGQSIRFSGTVAQVQAAFATQIHRVQFNGVEHLANLTAPTLPAAIAAVSAGISGLDDFAASPRPRTRSITTSAAGAPKPEFTSPYSGNVYIAPGDVYTIYDEAPALTANINGTGVSIAVLAQSNIHLADIAAFRQASGLAANAPTVKVYGGDPGYANPADVSEAEMAVEWAGATAPSASIILVDTSSVLNSLISAVTNNVAPVVVDSYAQCEADLGATNIALYSSYLAQAAAQGMTVVTASGDAGATACDAGATTATNGLAVNFPASSPYVTAVGGTEFNDTTGNYWSASNGSTGGSALSYIPEVAWNENSISPLLATGGGASQYFPKPSWQQGNGVPSDFARDVPDVALQASLNFEGHLICEAGYCITGFYSLSPSLDIAGGTDVAAPEFAGFLALVVQKQGRIGVANNTLYALANSARYAPAVFHDVTSGSNLGPCQTGTTGCSTGALGYNAGTGYDLATGWGSVDVFNLVNDWALVAPLATTPAGVTASITNVTASASRITAGTSVTLTASVVSGVSSVTTQPTGTVQFTVDNVAVGSAVTLSNGTATYALATAALAAGSHTVQASYTGDSTFAGSRGSFRLDISAATLPDFTLTPATTTITVASGAIANGTVFTVTPINGFTGDVSFTATASTSLTATPAFNPTTVHITGTAAQTTTFTLLAYQALVQTGTSTLAANHVPAWQRAGSGVFFAGLALLLVPRRRRIGALLVAVVTLGSLGLSGCFGNGTSRSSGPTRVNTPPGTYTITVVATGLVNGTAVSHSSTITLVVQ